MKTVQFFSNKLSLIICIKYFCTLTRFDRKLLGKLSCCAWTCIKTETQRLLGRDDVVPGMIAGIQTHGELLHLQPRL